MRKSLLLIPVGLLVVLVAGVLLYTKVIAGDPPERLSFSDSPATTAAPGAPATTAAAGAPTGSIEGRWQVAPPSQAGYRAKEILFGQSVTAVGRTEAVTGEMTIQGTTVSSGSFTVDLTKVKSDREQRDGQFQGRIMNTAQFPTSTFVLSSPISLGSLPPAADAETTVQAGGRLTLKGRTNEVSFPLKARRNGATIEVNGTIPVRFADYGIANPSGGPAQVGDEGEVEVLLVFAKA